MGSLGGILFRRDSTVIIAITNVVSFFPCGALHSDPYYLFSFFRWNMYTAPAYFMSVVVGVILCLLVFIFQDQTVRNSETNKKNKKKSTKRAAIDDHANQMTITGFTVYDCCIFGCMLLNVSTKGNIGVFETLGVSIAESHFGLYSAEAGVIVASCGTIGVFSLLSMGYLARYLTDIQLICGGMVVMSAGIMSLAFLEDDDTNPSWKYIVAIFMLYSIGYPIGHTAVIGLFSKSKCPWSLFFVCSHILDVAFPQQKLVALIFFF